MKKEEAKDELQPVRVNLDESIQSVMEVVETDRKMKNCSEKTATELKLKLKLGQLKAVFIHPDNHTYPVFTMRLYQLALDFQKLQDHDDIGISINNFQIFDNLRYPCTLDPHVEY